MDRTFRRHPKPLQPLGLLPGEGRRDWRHPPGGPPTRFAVFVNTPPGLFHPFGPHTTPFPRFESRDSCATLADNPLLEARMACSGNCPCCKSACCCSRTGSARAYSCCQAHCPDCEAAFGEGTAPGENCDSASVDGCDSEAMVARLPLGYCCEDVTDECIPHTTECECLREGGDYVNPCSGASVPDNGGIWGWTVEPDCEISGNACCPCGSVCCLGAGDTCCDPANSLCCRNGTVCCDGVCCPPGYVCVDGVCTEGCVNDGDCVLWYHECQGIVYGPYNSEEECIAAFEANEDCEGDPETACYTGPLEERCCCDGVCQDCPCPEGQSVRLLSAPAKKSRAWRRLQKLRAKLAGLPRPWHGPGSSLKAVLLLIGVNASPTCGCNKKAKEMDSMGIRWSIANRREILALMETEAAKRKLFFSPRGACVLFGLAMALSALAAPWRTIASRRKQ